MIPTPDISHLKAKDYEHIYEPAEDTFALLDALEQEAEELKSANPKICLEIGSGSGCVSAFVASILGRSCLYLCTDINPYANTATLATGKQNNCTLDAIKTSLHTSLLPRLYHSVDLLLFNPPYVPTEAEEEDWAQEEALLGGSWAGGLEGMNVTERLLKAVPDLLAPNGRFYMVAVARNKPSDILESMSSKGLTSDIVLSRRAGREHLYILRFIQPS